MTRYVVTADVVLRLVEEGVAVDRSHQLVAPTLVRSEVLTRLYQASRRGEVSPRDAAERLDRMRALRMRLLGDRVLQRVAWQVADRLGWDDTSAAEYVALTQLQADALVTLDDQLAAAAADLVTVAPYDALLRPDGG